MFNSMFIKHKRTKIFRTSMLSSDNNILIANAMLMCQYLPFIMALHLNAQSILAFAFIPDNIATKLFTWLTKINIPIAFPYTWSHAYSD